MLRALAVAAGLLILIALVLDTRHIGRSLDLDRAPPFQALSELVTPDPPPARAPIESAGVPVSDDDWVRLFALGSGSPFSLWAEIDGQFAGTIPSRETYERWCAMEGRDPKPWDVVRLDWERMCEVEALKSWLAAYPFRVQDSTLSADMRPLDRWVQEALDTIDPVSFWGAVSDYSTSVYTQHVIDGDDEVWIGEGAAGERLAFLLSLLSSHQTTVAMERL